VDHERHQVKSAKKSANPGEDKAQKKSAQQSANPDEDKARDETRTAARVRRSHGGGWG
jgi:hypothetical protein